MKKSILFILLASYGYAGFSATHTVTNSGNTFTPAAISISSGDEVIFNIASAHNVVEVSKTTWDSQGNTPLSGGFSLPFGGGTLTADKLTSGIHYYVCSLHAEFGMKGSITVLDPTEIAENITKSGISIYPNPSSGSFQLKMDNSLPAKKYDLEIYTIKGDKVHSQSDIQKNNLTEIEISDLPKGVYIVRLNRSKENYYKKIVIQ